MSGSDKYFRKALKSGLNMGHDIAMANLNLASVAMARRRKREAMNYLTQVKKHDKSKLLNEQVRMLKGQMGDQKEMSDKTWDAFTRQRDRDEARVDKFDYHQRLPEVEV